MQSSLSWTAAGRSNIANEGLHQIFSRIASSNPSARAMVSEERTVSYGDLDLMSDAWAAGLLACGVGPGACVPILLPRSVDLVVALLAVLKTGAAYALLDVAWPDRRIREVVQMLRPSLLVSCRGTAERHGVPVWFVDASPAAAPALFRAAVVQGDDPCCVFFTSGTTGLPKAVLSSHRATARLFLSEGFARFSCRSAIPLAAPVPWDAFSLELWSMFLNGGACVLLDEPYLSSHALRRAISGHGVDTAWLTSSLFNMVIDEDIEAFAGLGQVMIGGERLSVPHVDRFLTRYPETRLVNGYGPVESTVFATTHRIVPADCDRPDGVPIGRPVAGTQVYVLDGSRVCGIGESGEICICGDGLALRYIGDPQLTTERFVEVVIGESPVRVYRTGDLGYWCSSGLLHFRGRLDRQLKVRGHRVEPAEVERQIEQLLAVRACRIVPRMNDAGGVKDIVAFCIPRDSRDALDGAAEVLGSGLVAYQRPAAVVAVERFPLTPQGKLDERALLALLATSKDADRGHHGASSPMADPLVALVARTFADVLGQPLACVSRSFFELGGDSLAAGRVVARLAALVGRAIPMSWLYRYPIATDLAEQLRTGCIEGDEPVDCEAAEVPLSPMQLVYLTRHLMDPADLTSHCVLTWLIEGELDCNALEQAIDRVHARHQPLRAAYVPDPRPLARATDISSPPLEVLSAEASLQAATAVMLRELAEPLELTEGEVWRTVLIPITTPPAALFGCVVHHIAFDGGSESVLASELGAAYGAVRTGSPQQFGCALPAPSQPRAPYSRPPEGRGLGAARDYVVRELSHVPALCWPTAPPPDGCSATSCIDVDLSATLVRALDGWAARAGVSRFVVLLQYWARALAEVSDQRDFCLGVPVRCLAPAQPTIGCHINMVFLRLREGALEPGAAGLCETGRIAREALAAQDLPFSEVLELVGQPRTARPPVFQTLFALQDNPTPSLVLEGAGATLIRQPYLQLPLELHAEVWPGADGALRLAISYRSDSVHPSTAEALATRFASLVGKSRTGTG